MDCHYLEDECGQEDGDKNDIFSIGEVRFQSIGELEWKNMNYILNTDSLDWALCDCLTDLLLDQGVDETFSDELSKALDHQNIAFLQDLKSFVKSQ